jgi:glycine/D-amino acid oxidase-like deaminating enzyme
MAAQRNALILGAGIMGLCTAWALAHAGWQVRVIEQAPIPNPRGASVDQHRLIRHAYGAQAGYMRMVDPAYAAWDMIWAALGARHYVETGVLALANHHGGWLAESRAALRADAVVGDVRGLQLIQPIFGARILQPAQAIEKIMQAIARGNLAGAENESLIGFAFS